MTLHFWSLCVVASLTFAKSELGPNAEFKTQPTFRAAIVNVNKTDPQNRLQAGYTFLSPYGEKGFPPQIFDDDGELVWYGGKESGGARAMCFGVCDYLGQKHKHLCWGQLPKFGGLGAMHNRIFRNTYAPMDLKYGKTKGFEDLNPHEYNMLPGGQSFVRAVYRKKRMDLRPYKGGENGIITDGCFQEISVKDGSERFRWCYLDHLPEHETYLYLDIPQNKVNLSSAVGGKGNFMSPWDFLHLNAVDKNKEGDYLISARHMNQVIKIAGNNNRHGVKPGTVLWRLGGKHSDFEMAGDALFSRQHHVRFVETKKDRTVVSLFNNAWEGINEATARVSSGLVIEANNKTKKATLRHAYAHPYGKLSPAQGSIQLLPNGNVMVGWGSKSEYSEFTQGGELLLHAHFSQGPINYRTLKFEWTGHPRTKPKLLAYTHFCRNTPLIAYVSWNGATLVRYWRFHVSITSSNGPWIVAGTFAKQGFETKAQLSSGILSKVTGFVPFVSVQALDAEKKVLATSLAKTFVPRRDKELICDTNGCSFPKRFSYEASDFSRAGGCRTGVRPNVVVLLFIVFVIELADYFVNSLLIREVLSRARESRRAAIQSRD